MESKPKELPAAWQERIEVDAKARWPLHVNEPENENYRKAYETGAMVYAPCLYTCQMNYAALRAKAEKMEQALKEAKTWVVEALASEDKSTVKCAQDDIDLIEQALEQN